MKLQHPERMGVVDITGFGLSKLPFRVTTRDSVIFAMIMDS